MVLKPEESEKTKAQDNFAEKSNDESNENSKQHFILEVQNGTMGTSGILGGK